MASTVQPHRALSPAAVRDSRVSSLSCRNSAINRSLRGRVFDNITDCITSSNQPITSIDVNLPPTPCSSSDREPQQSGRDSLVDPVALLTRPVEGFHYPRQHLFTDRLVGRFFEDGSLDAETRKISKCLAGRLGTARTGGSSTRPGAATSVAALSHSQPYSHNIPLEDTFGGTGHAKRIHGGSSASSLGNRGNCGSKGQRATRPQKAGCTGLSARKEQVEKEIMEQKALIEKLEGRMASLSSRGRAGEREINKIPHAAVEDESPDIGESRQAANNICRPRSTPGSLQQPCGEEKDLETKREKTLKIQSSIRQQQARSREEDIRADTAHHQGRSVQSTTAKQTTTCRSVVRREQQETDSATAIQRNTESDDQHRKFLSLRSAREELERNLSSISSLAESLVVENGGEIPKCDSSLPGRNKNAVERVGSAEGAPMALVARLLETSREDDLTRPPFEPLRSMYHQFGILEDTLSLLVTAVNDSGNAKDNAPSACRSLTEYFAATRIALDRIKDALGVGDDELQTVRRSPAVSAASPIASPHRLPAGSGRAVAVAAASGKGGILVSPDQVEPSPRPAVSNALRFRNGSPAQSAGERGRMKLSSLSVEAIGRLLRANGFRDDAAGFVSQAVDGAMLNDPNLCEEDFRELGLGETSTSDGATGHGTSITRLLAFFKACQKDGVMEPTGGVDYSDTGFSTGSEQARLGEKNSSNTNGRCDGATGPGVEPGGPLQEAAQVNSAAIAESDSSGGDLWRRSSIELDRENQTIIANIPLDQFDETEDQISTSHVERIANGRRISVRRNNGIVVTAGGLQPALVRDVDGLDTVDADSERDDTERGKSSAIIDGADHPLRKSSRKASVALKSVVLDVEDEQSAMLTRRLSDGPGEGLPPEMIVKTGGLTIDIFDSHVDARMQ